MSALDLDAIEARERAATPGPWIGDRYDGTVKYMIMGSDETPVVLCAWDAEGNRSGFQRDEDESFTMHAREDVPAMAREIRRLREENARLSRNVATAETELVQCRELRDRLGEAVEDLADGGETFRWIHDWRRARMYEDVRGIPRTTQRPYGRLPLPAPPEVK